MVNSIIQRQIDAISQLDSEKDARKKRLEIFKNTSPEEFESVLSGIDAPYQIKAWAVSCLWFDFGYRRKGWKDFFRSWSGLYNVHSIDTTHRDWVLLELGAPLDWIQKTR